MKITYVIGAFPTVANAAIAHASEPLASWEHEGRISLWGSRVGGTTATGQDAHISFSDVLDKLDFAVMGRSKHAKGAGHCLPTFGISHFLTARLPW